MSLLLCFTKVILLVCQQEQDLALKVTVQSEFKDSGTTANIFSEFSRGHCLSQRFLRLLAGGVIIIPRVTPIQHFSRPRTNVKKVRILNAFPQSLSETAHWNKRRRVRACVGWGGGADGRWEELAGASQLYIIT